MNNAGDRGDERWSAAWQALRDHDSELHAPQHLEAAVMAALNGPRTRRGGSRTRLLSAIAASLAAVAALWTLAGPRARSVSAPLEVRALMPVAPLAPGIDAAAIAIQETAVQAQLAKQAPSTERTTVVLMMFEPMPASPAETLQLVRLRVPGEALLALGLPPFEPDASGLVDIDMLVGEDGLPRNIRKIHVEQEER
jgi:hypothetical protein